MENRAAFALIVLALVGCRHPFPEPVALEPLPSGVILYGEGEVRGDETAFG